MRVGIVLPGWRAPGTSGALPGLEDLVGGLAARSDVDLRIVSLRHPAPRARYRDTDGVPVMTLGAGARAGIGGRSTLTLAALRAVRTLHQEAPLDVLHAFWVDEPGAVAVIAGRLLGVPVGTSVMGGELVGMPDIDYGATLGLGGRMTSQLTGRGGEIATVGSGTLFRTAATWMPELPLRLVPLGVDTARFRPSLHQHHAARPRILAVGSLSPVKDHVLLLRAFARLRTSKVDLAIVGDGPMRAGLGRLADRLGVHDRVAFLGAVPRADLPDLYRSAALLMVTSRHEAQSMVAVEAAACGIGVIGTAVGVVPELAAAGGASMILDRDPAALAAAVDDALAGPATSMGTAARVHAVAAWRIEETVHRFAGLWQELAASALHRAPRETADD